MRKKFYHGFTLMELSVVLLVLSLMLGSILTVVNQNTRIEKQKQAREKIARIQTALLNYAKKYRRLPCPGSFSYATTSTYFGREGQVGPTCQSGTPKANYTDPLDLIFGGSVPVKTLGLADEDILDPWGHYFVYVVDKALTNTTASDPFNTYPVTDTGLGALTVNDMEAQTITSKAVYVLLSHGPNGHGGYTLQGTRVYAGSTNPYEQSNCNCASDGGLYMTTSKVYYQMRETSSNSTSVLYTFDDITVFARRQDLMDWRDQLTELP